MEFDDLLKLLGEFGRYQKIMFFLVCLLSIPGALNNLSIVFLAAVPNHWCTSPGTADLNLSIPEVLNLTAPRMPDSPDTFDKCQRYDRNYTGWTADQVKDALMSPPGNDTKIIECDQGWDYDKSVYTSTIVTEWDLVCDKKALVPTASSVFMAGFMVGVLFFGTLSDMLGRKIALSSAFVLSVAFAIIICFSTNYILFVVMRFFIAATSIGTFTTAFVLGIEMVGPTWRVFAGIVIEYFWAIGYIMIAGVAYGLREWKALALGLSVPQVLFLPIIYILPESARWLYSQNKHAKGDVIIKKMAEVNKVELPSKIDVEIKKIPRAYVWDLFRFPKLRIRTINIMFNWFVNSMVYYGLSLNSSKLGGDDYLNFFIGGAVEIPAYIFCHISLQYLGRRKNLSATMILGGLALLCMLAVPKHLNVVTIVLAMFGKLCISASFAIIYVFSAELFPTVVRNVGIGSGSFCARIGGIIAPFIGALSDISVLIPYITFGALSVLAGLLALLLPETMNEQLPESIQDGENFPMRTRKDQVSPEYIPTVDGKLSGGLTNTAYQNGDRVKNATKL